MLPTALHTLVSMHSMFSIYLPCSLRQGLTMYVAFGCPELTVHQANLKRIETHRPLPHKHMD